MGFTLDYGKMIFLDAEDLAEGGVKRAYDSLREALRAYVSDPAGVREIADSEVPSYTVECRGLRFPIYAPDLEDEESWGRAAHALFTIVNNQLSDSEYRLYAFYGGNDLGGMFLTRSECDQARNSLASKQEWPYLPTLEHPWYGQPHD